MGGCSSTECGTGTVNRYDVCVPLIRSCGEGTQNKDGVCVPLISQSDPVIPPAIPSPSGYYMENNQCYDNNTELLVPPTFCEPSQPSPPASTPASSAFRCRVQYPISTSPSYTIEKKCKSPSGPYVPVSFCGDPSYTGYTIVEECINASTKQVVDLSLCSPSAPPTQGFTMVNTASTGKKCMSPDGKFVALVFCGSSKR